MKKIQLLFYRQFWEELYYNIKWGIISYWRYRHIVWKTRDWDYHFILNMMQFQLTLLHARLQNGNEVYEDRILKIQDIERCIEILDNIEKDNYLDRVGGAHFLDYPFKLIPNPDGSDTYVQTDYRTPDEKAHDREQMKAALNLEKLEWDELWNIIKKGNKSSHGLHSWWD